MDLFSWNTSTILQLLVNGQNFPLKIKFLLIQENKATLCHWQKKNKKFDSSKLQNPKTLFFFIMTHTRTSIPISATMNFYADALDEAFRRGKERLGKGREVHSLGKKGYVMLFSNRNVKSYNIAWECDSFLFRLQRTSIFIYTNTSAHESLRCYAASWGLRKKNGQNSC